MARLITAGQATLLAALLPWSGSAVAQPVTSAPTASASEEDPAPPAPVVLAFPGMTGPLTLNPDPTAIDAGPLGDLYVTGVASAIGLRQDRPLPGDDRSRLAIGNAQLFVQDTDGPLQFAVQAGLYSFPSLGSATLSARDTTRATFGVIPQAFVKLVPSSNFSLMIGKLSTLAGAEYTFSFENMNVNRGLLWNQENAVNRGVQANVAKGPLSLSLSLNDGFYSGKYNWLSGLVTYAASPKDTLSVVAMGNVGETHKTGSATPLLQNNGQIYNFIWTHSAGPWVVTPYLQLTRVPRNRNLGISRSASTLGAAVLARYLIAPGLSLAGRAEYITSSGSPGRGTPNLLYGAGSDAWSLTVTPTFQRQRFFVRGEIGFVRVLDRASGSGFGASADKPTQTRASIESGIIF